MKAATHPYLSTLMAQQKITMKSIAADLGVSRSTVSFVLGGEAEKHRINPETAQRIVKYAEDIGFRPNYFAQALNRGKTGSIGLVFPDVHEIYMSEMLRGIDEVFARHDATMMLSSSRMCRRLEMRNIDSLLYRGVDGLIIIPCADFNSKPTGVASLARVIAKSKLPAVCVDRVPDDWTGSSVVQDDRSGAREAVDLLVRRGAKRVACISFNLAASSIASRIAGYHDALREHGRVADPRLLVLLDQIDAQANDLSDAIRALLALGEDERPDAWFVTTSGLSYRTRDLTVSLSGDAAAPLIARFGADPPFFTSGMISVHQPHREIGRQSAELLFKLMADPGAEPTQIVVPTTVS